MGDQATARGGIDVDVPKNEPPPQASVPFAQASAPAVVPVAEDPVAPLLLDHDHQIATKNELMTIHLILRRLPLSRLLERLWMVTCYGAGVMAMTDLP